MTDCNRMSIILVFLLLTCLINLSFSGPTSVTASVRGKKYEVEAETVEEFISKVCEVANLDPEQQSVLFKGKILNSSDILQEIGVQKSDILMIVKGKRSRSKQEIESDSQSMNVDSLMGSDKMPSSPADMQNAMKAMDNLLDSNFVDEYFKDDETLENARKQMLENLDQYEKMMPGFKNQAMEIVSSPEKW